MTSFINPPWPNQSPTVPSHLLCIPRGIASAAGCSPCVPSSANAPPSKQPRRDERRPERAGCSALVAHAPRGAPGARADLPRGRAAAAGRGSQQPHRRNAPSARPPSPASRVDRKHRVCGHLLAGGHCTHTWQWVCGSVATACAAQLPPPNAELTDHHLGHTGSGGAADVAVPLRV
jgi:hypothetical protein